MLPSLYLPLVLLIFFFLSTNSYKYITSPPAYFWGMGIDIFQCFENLKHPNSIAFYLKAGIVFSSSDITCLLTDGNVKKKVHYEKV